MARRGAHLDAVVGLDRGGFSLDATISAEPGEVLAVLGPNGAGKSTLVGCLGGLLPLARGAIRLDGTVLDDPALGVFVPPQARPVGLLFQDYLLFPTQTVLENVAFPLRAAGRPRRAARRVAMGWLERLGLADRAAERPAALSGGQQQRVALARALVDDPVLVLLDEPLAALDAQTRATLRHELRQVLAERGATALVVTHDPLDVHVVADRVVVLEHGQVRQRGSPRELAARPATPYVAELMGLNLLAGTVAGHQLRLPGGGLVAVADAPEGPCQAVVAPSSVALHRREPEGSPRNVWQLTVAGTERVGDRVRVRLEGPVPLTAEITAEAAAALALEPGAQVWASVKATEIRTHRV